MTSSNAAPFIAARDFLLRRRVELRRAEAANQRDGKRAKLEFWEDDFSENEMGLRSEKV